MEAIAQEVSGRISAGQILLGDNPRTHFDPVKLAELKEGIKAAGGILQPLLVRPTDAGLVLVAGGRRLRSVLEIWGPDREVPYLSREMSDEEARAFALQENVQRDAMSPTEEAVAAARILADCNGDHDEGARRLGMSRSTFDKRLALMNCSPAVQTALNERKIDLGHAELLASIARDKQDVALANIFKAKITVAQLKAMIGELAKKMADAIFDRSECTTCPHNSDNQAALFQESIGTGHCTNSACYDEKTEKDLEARRVALTDTFPRVEIVRPGDNFKVIALVASGANGVGEEQAAACRACANFGAVVSAIPGKLGKQVGNQCFDTVCNKSKVEERIKAEKEAAAEAEAETKADQSKPSAAKAQNGATTKKAAPKKPAPTVADAPRVKEYRVKIWRKATKKELMLQPDKNLTVLVAMGVAGELRHISGVMLNDAFGKMLGGDKVSMTSKLPEAIEAVTAIDTERRQTMIHGITVSTIDSLEERRLIDVMQYLQVDLAKHWTLNPEFLKLLTKSEIEVLAEEIGLKAHMGDKFAKTMKLKVDDIVKGLLSVQGFEYAGRVPRSMQFKKP